MWNEVANRLLTVKSLVTLIMTAVFAVLALRDGTVGQEFMTVYTVVISFYFGTQVSKKEAKGNANLP